MLVELMQQGWAAAARLLAWFAKVVAGVQGCKLVPHLLGLERATRSSNPEVAAAAARVLQGLAAQECLDHVDQFMQWMQQGSAAAGQLLVRVAGVPGAKQHLLQHEHLPTLVAAAGFNAAAEQVLQQLVAPECLGHVGKLVQLLQQGNEAVVAAKLLLQLMQLPEGKQAVLQHLSALVWAAGSSAEAAVDAAASVRRVLAVPECIPHLGQLARLMQQGWEPAAQLVVQLVKLPGAKKALLQQLPVLMASVEADNSKNAEAAVALIHDLAGCGPGASSATDASDAQAGRAALGQLDLMPLLCCIARRPAVGMMCVTAFAAAVPSMASAAAGTAALQRYVAQLLGAADTLAATRGADSLSIAQHALASACMDAVSAIAGCSAAGLQAAHACMPQLAAALSSSSSTIISAALKMLHMLLNSKDSSKQAALLQEGAKQHRLVEHLKVVVTRVGVLLTSCPIHYELLS
jgi:hypothetical protein